MQKNKSRRNTYSYGHTVCHSGACDEAECLKSLGRLHEDRSRSVSLNKPAIQKLMRHEEWLWTMWCCLIRAVNKEIFKCAVSAHSKSMPLNRKNVIVFLVQCVFSSFSSSPHITLRSSTRRSVVAMYVCKGCLRRRLVERRRWMCGGFRWTGNDVVGSQCMRACSSVALQRQSSGLSVPGCQNKICMASHRNQLMYKNGCENNAPHLHFSAGIFSLSISPFQPSVIY